MSAAPSPHTLPAPRFAPSKPSPLAQSSSFHHSHDSDPPSSSQAGGGHHTSEKSKKKRKKSHNQNGQTVGQPMAGTFSGGDAVKGSNQPFPVAAADGPGKMLATQLVKLVNHLKYNNGAPMNLIDLEAQTGVRGLLTEFTEFPFDAELFDAFKGHDRVVMNNKGPQTLFSYRPDYDLRSAADVLRHLKRYLPRGGMPVHTLKESWSEVVPVLQKLEEEGKILALRDEKGKSVGQMKTVFYDAFGDRGEVSPPSKGALDEEFRDLWTTIATPDISALPGALADAGLTPTESSGYANRQGLPHQGFKKKKSKGRGGKSKITNTHAKEMGVDLSKDFIVPGKK